MNASVLRVHIEVSKPVELLDLTLALRALGNEYARFAVRQGVPRRDDQVKLFVQEVRKGSIEFDLVDLVTAGVVVAPVVMEHFNLLADFSANLKNILAWACGSRTKEPPEASDLQTLTHIEAILAPLVKDRGSSMTLGPVVNNAPVENQTIIVNHIAATQGSEYAADRKREIEEPAKKIHEKVLLRWYQTRNDPGSTVGDSAIVETIQNKHVKTVFMAESVKARMLAIESNIYHRGFLVDLRVESVKGRPKLYVIMAIHDETVDLDSEE